MAQIYKTAMKDAERFRYEEQLSAKDAEIERLKDDLATAMRGWDADDKENDYLESKLEALNAFVTAFDDAQATNFKLPEFTVPMNKARAALEE